MKKIFILFLSVLVLFIAGCKEHSIKINGPAKIEIGEQVELTIQSTKSNADFLVKTDREDIVAIEDKIVIGLKEGNAVIKVSLLDDESVFAEHAIQVVIPEGVEETMVTTKDFFASFLPETAENRIILPYSEELTFIESIVYPDTMNQLRPGFGKIGQKMNGGVKFIVVHDTGMPSSIHDAAGVNRYFHEQANSKEGRVASWHYTVGNDAIYHHVPDDEIAWHAGDGVRSWKLTDTGLKADSQVGTKANVTITDGYWTFDGKVSEMKAPEIEGRAARTVDLVDSGIISEVGGNGNYYIGTVYYNTEYKKIANTGGGANGIGIETCINQGSDYQLTMIKTAKLVAYLLNKHHLGLNAVTQHNNFSGKGCPAVIRSTGRWDEFLKHVEFQLALLESKEDIEFSFSFDKVGIIDQYGTISQQLINDEVVNIVMNLKINGVTREFQFPVLVKGMTTDEKLSSLFLEIFNNEIPKETQKSIVLPTYNEKYKAHLEWTSDHPEILSNTGEYQKPSGVVYVTLSVTMTIDNVSLKKALKVRVS